MIEKKVSSPSPFLSHTLPIPNYLKKQDTTNQTLKLINTQEKK